MAKLPDITARRGVASSNQAISSDRSGQILAESVGRFSQTVGDIGNALQERENRFQYARAKSQLYRADAQIRRELAQDPDFSTYETRYRERLQTVIEQAQEGIVASSDRELFAQDAMMDIERGAATVSSLAIEKEGNLARADLAEALEANRTAALEADEATRNGILLNSNDMIKAAEEAGYIDATASQRLRQDWSQSFAAGAIEMLDVDERIEILESPEGTPAELLRPDDREKLLDVAKKERESLRIRMAGQEAADTILASTGDRAEALRQARQIEDAKVRDDAVSRVNARFSEMNAAEAEQQQAAFMEVSQTIDQDPWSEIDTEKWWALSPSQRKEIESRSARLQAGMAFQTDPGTFYELQRQIDSDPQAFAQRNLMELRSRLDEGDFKRFAALQTDVQANGVTASDLTSAQTFNERVENTLISTGLFNRKPAASDKSNQTRWATIEREMARNIENASNQLGRKLTPEEQQGIIDEIVLQRVFIDRPFARDPEKLGVELTDDEIGQAYVPYDGIPDSERMSLQNLARSLGREASREKIQRAYAQALLGDREAMISIMGE